MNHRSIDRARMRRSLAAALAAVVLGTTGAVSAGAPVAAQAPPGAIPDGGPERLEVETSRPVAEGTGGWTAYPVPTSDAGLARIQTAPGGDMWFVMEDANKIGRITPAGVISELGLPETTTGAQEGVKDLEIAADGTLWVVYDHGRRIVHVDPATLTGQVYVLGAYPYGEEVEMGPDGVPWVTMDYDESGVSRVLPDGAFWHENAPECDGAIARAGNGTMWCQKNDDVIRINADASGGTIYPLPEAVAYPDSLAAGPTGSIWFARYNPGSWLTSARSGQVGWIDEATGQVSLLNTGERTAPFNLTPGPGGRMWFTSGSHESGIGHVNAQGQGAIVKIGDYLPRFLTLAADGAVWFTDAIHNTIVRVAPGQLETTNMDPGADSVFVQPAAPAPAPPEPAPPAPAPQAPGTLPPGTPAAPVAVVGKVAPGKAPLRVRRNTVRLPVACPKTSADGCEGLALLRHRKKAKALSKAVAYTVRAGRTKVVTLRLTKAGRRTVGRRPTAVRASLVTTEGNAVTDRRVRLRR